MKKIFSTLQIFIFLFMTVSTSRIYAYGHPADITTFASHVQRQVIAPYIGLVTTSQMVASELTVINGTTYTFTVYFDGTYSTTIPSTYLGDILVPFSYSELAVSPGYAQLYKYQVDSNAGTQTVNTSGYAYFSGLGNATYVWLQIGYP